MTRRVYNKIGYYDENLLYGEDVDFTWRAISAGYKIRANNKAIVFHDWGDIGDEIRRSYKYGKGRAILYKKHYYRWKNFIKNDRIGIIYALYILGLPLTLVFPMYPLLILVPVVINIRKQNFYLIVKLIVMNLINGFGILYGIFFNRYKY